MAKKSKLPLIYLIGMVLTVVGFCVPMFQGKLLGTRYNGFDFINFDSFGFVTIGALLIFIGAVCGVVLSFLGGKNMNTFRLVALLVSIAGGIVLFIGFTTGSGLSGAVYKQIAKHLLKCAFVGFYMVIAGWVVSLIGWVMKK